jgi:hypothetical protein
MYMLGGGTDASNPDPYAQKPEPNNNSVETGPHVMIVGAKGCSMRIRGMPNQTPQCPTSCALTRRMST